MKRAALGLVLLGVGLLWLAACNQGSGGTKVTVKLVSPIDGGSPATATVVYQVENGEWRLAAQEAYGIYSFTIPSGEKRYGVAVNCLPGGLMLGTFGWGYVYQLTTDDTTTIQTSCLNISDLTLGRLAVTPQKANSDTGTYDRAWVYADYTNDYGSLGSPLSIISTAGTSKELLAIAYNGSYQPDNIKRIVFKRDLTIDQSSLAVAVTFTAADTPNSQTVSSFTIPQDATDSYFGVGFASKGGIVVPQGSRGTDQPQLGSGDKNGGGYWVIPNTINGDLYIAEASAEKTSGATTYRLTQVKLFGPGPEDPHFQLPSSWFDPSIDEKTYPKFANLAYNDPALVGYTFMVKLGGFVELIYVSRSWLGGATAYAVPDLSGASDFGGTKPLPGDPIAWSAAAVMANHPLGELVAAPTIALATPLPSINGLSIRIASKEGSYNAP